MIRGNQLHFVGYQMSVKQRYQHQRFDYLVAIDLKTSVVGLPGKSHQTEIVEVNAVAVNTLNLDRQKAFAGCCHPDLADFSFVETIRKFSQWLFQLNGPFILVTDNYNTLGSDFPNQCLISGLNVPTFAAEWLNICEFWRQRYGNQNEVTSDSLLEHFGRNRKLNNQAKRSSHCDAQSLAIIVADVLEIHQYFQFTTNESFRKC
ncbi:uncharacterized protein LOC124313317 isoform X2 [Daphnia pulicaria]|uniref:uncharacterized protein LOC124313317 isoform X2 n=1 Tax=Daphnia pulicaria TaxID=35523 RepID=UPI001EEAD22A|nr:uncharacterized protein LOC124313317 isoform X2 [Daphnia pulicaria]